MKIWTKLVMFAILLVVVLILFFSLRSLKKPEIEKFELTEISNINVNGFTINGNLHIRNDNKISIPIENITYYVSLKESDEVITDGEIDTVTLRAKDVTVVPTEFAVNWKPSARLLINMLLEDEVIAVVTGEVALNIKGLENYKLSFEEEIDIKEYIRNL